MNTRLMRITSRLLIASVLSLALPIQAAQAEMIGADQVVSSSSHAQTERERIRTFLDRADVSEQLQAQGIDANTAKARVAALTDEEVLKVAGKMDQMPAGGDILGILFTVFVILLVTDILGLTSVFSFTHSAR